MTKTPPPPIEVPIPPGFYSEDEGGEEVNLVAYFRKFVKDSDCDQSGVLLEAFDLTIDDDRCELYRVTIEEVDLEESGVTVHYAYCWGGYSGCADIVLDGNGHGTADGVVVGNKWVFPHHVPHEPLAPNEEL